MYYARFLARLFEAAGLLLDFFAPPAKKSARMTPSPIKSREKMFPEKRVR